MLKNATLGTKFTTKYCDYLVSRMFIKRASSGRFDYIQEMNVVKFRLNGVNFGVATSAKLLLKNLNVVNFISDICRSIWRAGKFK